MKKQVTVLRVALALWVLGVGAVHAGIESNLVSDGGFESISGNSPNPGEIPWFTDESANGQLVSESAIIHSGSVAVVWQFYFATPTLIQTLGTTVQPGKNYELDLWHAIGEASSNGSHINPPTFTASIWTSPTVDGAYSQVASRSGIVSTSGEGVYTNYVETFTAAELSGVTNQYMQLRIKKDNENSTHRIFIDDVSFGVQVVTGPAQFFTSPADQLSLFVGDASGVVTGSVDVSYLEGAPPTNVVITSVSVVDQTNPGAFSSASTNLPLTLAAPAPASDSIGIAYDNATGGLLSGETATGVVEIVWNEVGAASSTTSSLPVRATFLAVNANNTVAIFDHRSANANPRLQGLVATLSGYHGISTSQGSTDGTYGSLYGNARTDGGGVQASLNYPVISMAVTNSTGYDCTLDSLHFDAAKMWNKGLLDINVSISGDVTPDAALTNYSGLTQFSGSAGDYDDFDIDLSGLADHVLAHGEAALIQFTFSNGDPSNSNAVSVIDNIALLGTGSNGAALTKVPGGWVSIGLSGLDTGASELIDMFYTEGDAATNVVITGVSFVDETDPGAFSYSGTLPLDLATPGETNSIVSLLFDNTVANVQPGNWSYAKMQIAWNEKGLPSRTFDIDVYATRPSDVPTNTVLALLDTEFLTADGAVNGVKARMGGDGAVLEDSEQGSNDGTYGSLTGLSAPTNNSRWRISGINNTATLSITNTTVADLQLSSLHFDIGRWYSAASDEFTLSVSGDVTDVPALLVTNLSVMGFQNYDFDDIDVDLTGLADHTLRAGESLVFSITLTPKAGADYYNVWIDNLALMGTADGFGGWAGSTGLTPGLNDGRGQNPDADAMDNLMEYATGHNPLVADGPAAGIWQASSGGTNWLYHVHTERQDDTSLSYGVGAKQNLLYDPVWDAGAVEEVGATSGPGLFRSVTNRTDMGPTEKFIGLTVDQN